MPLILTGMVVSKPEIVTVLSKFVFLACAFAFAPKLKVLGVSCGALVVTVAVSVGPAPTFILAVLGVLKLALAVCRIYKRTGASRIMLLGGLV